MGLIRCLASAEAKNLAEVSEAILRILSKVRVVIQDACSTCGQRAIANSLSISGQGHDISVSAMHLS